LFRSVRQRGELIGGGGDRHAGVLLEVGEVSPYSSAPAGARQRSRRDTNGAETPVRGPPRRAGQGRTGREDRQWASGRGGRADAVMPGSSGSAAFEVGPHEPLELL